MVDKKVLAIIPARGGSKGIINKNVRLLRGKPLVHHAIDYAKQSKLIDKIVVSTDSDLIAHVAREAGSEVIFRPEHLSGDKALVIDAIKHVVDYLQESSGFKTHIVVLLECTSPIKSVAEIDQAIAVLYNENYDSVATFQEMSISPNRIWRIENNNTKPFIDGANPFLPRQVLPKGYQLTGQIYAVKFDSLISDPTNISIMTGNVFPIITQTEVIDIDQEMDLFIAEEMIRFLEENKNG